MYKNPTENGMTHEHQLAANMHNALLRYGPLNKFKLCDIAGKLSESTLYSLKRWVLSYEPWCKRVMYDNRTQMWHTPENTSKPISSIPTVPSPQEKRVYSAIEILLCDGPSTETELRKKIGGAGGISMSTFYGLKGLLLDVDGSCIHLINGQEVIVSYSKVNRLWRAYMLDMPTTPPSEWVMSTFSTKGQNIDGSWSKDHYTVRKRSVFMNVVRRLEGGAVMNPISEQVLIDELLKTKVFTIDEANDYIKALLGNFTIYESASGYYNKVKGLPNVY